MARRVSVNAKGFSRVSVEAMQQLEDQIWGLTGVPMFAKRYLIWLFRKSRGLTTEVKLSVVDSGELSHCIHNMRSSGGAVQLDRLFMRAGSDLHPESYFDGCDVSTILLVRDSAIGGRESWAHAKALLPTFNQINAVHQRNPPLS